MVELADELVCAIAEGVAAGEVVGAVGQSCCADGICVGQGDAYLIQAGGGDDVVCRYAVVEAGVSVRDGKLLPGASCERGCGIVDIKRDECLRRRVHGEGLRKVSCAL